MFLRNWNLTSDWNLDENIRKLYKNIDAGLNWQLVESNIDTAGHYKGNITFVDENMGFLAEGQFCTSDGGVTWTKTKITDNETVFFTESSVLQSAVRQ